MNEHPPTDTLTTFILIAANVAFVGIMAAFAWFVSWSGPGFAAGGISGAATFFVYTRIKLGYWI